MNVIEIAQKLIAVPSINPVGAGDLTLPGEAAMADAVTEVLQQAGASRITRTFPLENRPNVFGFFDFGRPDTIIFEAHMDTVPVTGMTVDPYAGRIDGGKLYGRGACDVKGPMAAMITALADVAAMATQDAGGAESADSGPRYNVLFAAVCDEESGFSGVCHFMNNLPRFHDKAPLFAIVAEPTDLQPVVAHKGTARWEVVTRGVAAHSSTPHLGVNAIYGMAPVIQRLQKLAAELESGPSHPQLGTATLSVGTIHGGSAVNIVPDECTLQVDRRLIPGELVEDGLAQLEAAMEGLDVEIRFPLIAVSPMEVPEDHTASLACVAAAKSTGAESAPAYAKYCTDAAFYQAAGVTAVVFGPGSITQAHTRDEFISIDELEKGVKAYKAIVLGCS
jgi:acetylornithine deacetylase